MAHLTCLDVRGAVSNSPLIDLFLTQGVAKASPPASPRSMPRGRPASDITKLYTGKLDHARSKTPDTADKPGPRKVRHLNLVSKVSSNKCYLKPVHVSTEQFLTIIFNQQKCWYFSWLTFLLLEFDL